MQNGKYKTVKQIVNMNVTQDVKTFPASAVSQPAKYQNLCNLEHLYN